MADDVTRPTLVTGQLQEDGGELVERVARAIQRANCYAPKGTPDNGFDWRLNGSRYIRDACAAIKATHAESETPTPGLTDDVVKELVEALEAFISTAVITPETHRVSSDEWVLSKCRAALAIARTGVTLYG